MEHKSVKINPDPSSRCYNCGLNMKSGDEHCFYQEIANEEGDLSKTNIICWKCKARNSPLRSTKSNRVLLRDICKAYEVEEMNVGPECSEHQESIKLWDTKYQCVRCAQCISKKKGSVEIGEGRFVFLEERVEEMKKLLEEELEEMDKSIAHYENEGRKIEKMREKVIQDAEECEEELRDCGERRAQNALQEYFRKQAKELDNQEDTQKRLKAEEEKMARREHTLKSRAHSIADFVKVFLERPALWMKADPLKLMEEDKEFWRVLNENWNQSDFDLSYGEPEFKFSNDEIINKLFKVEFSGPEQVLEIKDFNN